MKFRRLSTKSSALYKGPATGDIVGLTEWKWYWEKGNDVWEEYSQPVSNRLRQSVKVPGGGGLVQWLSDVFYYH